MNTEQRADFLCLRDRSVKNFQQEEASYYAIISQINQDLIRGYKIHTQCRQVEVQTPTSVNCSSYNAGYQVNTNCQQNTSTSTHQECTETPVPLDTALEKQKLAQFTDRKQQAEKNRATAYYNCYDRSMQLTAEEAYQVYKQ